MAYTGNGSNTISLKTKMTVYLEITKSSELRLISKGIKLGLKNKTLAEHPDILRQTIMAKTRFETMTFCWTGNRIVGQLS